MMEGAVPSDRVWRIGDALPSDAVEYIGIPFGTAVSRRPCPGGYDHLPGSFQVLSARGWSLYTAAGERVHAEVFATDAVGMALAVRRGWVYTIISLPPDYLVAHQEGNVTKKCKQEEAAEIRAAKIKVMARALYRETATQLAEILPEGHVLTGEAVPVLSPRAREVEEVMREFRRTGGATAFYVGLTRILSAVLGETITLEPVVADYGQKHTLVPGARPVVVVPLVATDAHDYAVGKPVILNARPEYGTASGFGTSAATGECPHAGNLLGLYARAVRRATLEECEEIVAAAYVDIVKLFFFVQVPLPASGSEDEAGASDKKAAEPAEARSA